MDGIYILKAFTSWYSIGLNHINGSDSSKSDSDSSKLSDLFEDTVENESINKNNQLWIDRSTCQITESRIPLTDEDPISEIAVDAFIGIVEVLNTYHLGVVTRSEVVAELNLEEISFNKNRFSKILMVKEVKFFPLQSTPEEVYTVTNPSDIMSSINYTSLGNLSNLTNIATTLNNTLLMSSQEQVQLQMDVQKILENMEKLLTTGYYFSYDTDLTNTMQNIFINNWAPLENLLKSQQSKDLENLEKTDKSAREKQEIKEKIKNEELMSKNKVLNKISNSDFNWCFKMGLNMPKKWMTVMIQGYVGYSVIYMNQDRIELLLIGRRNIKRCGTRFVARGIDEQGNVGNFVESEMRIRVNHRKWNSFVQNRGSVPIFWEQSNFTSPVNLFNFHLNLRSFTKHVDILKEFYKPCQYFLFVNLLDVKENEKMLSETYLEVVDEYNSNSSLSSGSSSTSSEEGEKKERKQRQYEYVEKDDESEEEVEEDSEGVEDRDNTKNRNKKDRKEQKYKETEEENKIKLERERRYCEKIELINYNYNVNAKWSTHEIIINYIMDNLSVQLDNVDYFDAEIYLENVNKYGSKSVCQRKRRNSNQDELLLIDDLLDLRTKEQGDKDKKERLEKEQKELEIMRIYRENSRKKDKEYKEQEEDKIRLEREEQEKQKEKNKKEGKESDMEEEYSKYHGSVYDDFSREKERKLVKERKGSKEVEYVVGIKESKDVKLLLYKNVKEKDGGDEEEKENKDNKEYKEGDKKDRNKKEKERQTHQEEEERNLGERKKHKEGDGLQKGVIRTNCLDCLDRTNIFQWMLAWVVFNKVLTENNSYEFDESEKEELLNQMLLGKEAGTGEENVLFNSFTELWCNHGDFISLHYSGTPSTLSERVKKQTTSLNSLLHYSKTMVQRYYSSLFQDSQRQTVFNILSPYSTAGAYSGAVHKKQGEELFLIEHQEREEDRKEEEDRIRLEREKGKEEQGQEIDEGGARRKLISSRYLIQDPFIGESSREQKEDKKERKQRQYEYVEKDDESEEEEGEQEEETTKYKEKQKQKNKEIKQERKKEEQKKKEGTESIFDRLNDEIFNKLSLLSKSTVVPTITTPETELGKGLVEERKEGAGRDIGLEPKLFRERDEVFRKEVIGEDLKIWVGTWNIGAHSVQINDDILSWMEIKKLECDMYVFNFQEFLELNFLNIATGRRDENKEFGFEHLITNLFRFSTKEKYEKLESISMTGLYLVIFVKKSLKKQIRDLMVTNVKTGLNYNIGNKGCVAISFKMRDHYFSFLNLHLNFGKNLNVGRIELMEYILRNSFKEYNKTVLDDSLFILGGDFNFSVELEKEVVLNLLKRMEYDKLFNYDEFNMAKMIGIPILGKLYESKIQFQPTYKYKDGTKYYTTKRAPAWCDRIILGGRLFDTNKVRVLTYKRNDDLIVSDHRPVSSIIVADINK